ncbi:MAG: diguanylate cyclase domain-containing protein [Sulfuriferula sp.]
MNRKHNDDTSDVDDPGQPGIANHGKGRQHVARGADRRRKDSAAMADEATALRHEKSTALRENAAGKREGAAVLREEAAHLRERAAQTREDEAHEREGAATTRERGILATEALQAADHILMLQQVNAYLVTSNIEAQKLTEQVEIAKVELAHLAHHDVLTDLPNRILLQDRLNQAIELARRQCTQLAVMFMDLDQFKHINDSLGHGIGDQLLQSVAQRLQACVRQSDTVSRQGGDEFVLLLPLIEHAEDAALSAQKLLAALVSPHHIDQHELHISVSIGISIYPYDGQDAETLIKNADTAMYHAKENGRNNYKFFEQSMNARAVQRQSVEAACAGRWNGRNLYCTISRK